MNSNWANFDTLPMKENPLRTTSWGSNNSNSSQDGLLSQGDNSSWKPHDTNFKIAKELVFGNKNNALEKAFKKAKDTNLGRELTQNMNNFNRTRNDEEKRQHPQINKMINQTLGSLQNSPLNFETPNNLAELLNKTRDTLENLTKLERRVKRLESFHETYRVGGYIKKKKSKTKKRKKKSKTKKRKTKRRRKSKTKKRIKRKRI